MQSGKVIIFSAPSGTGKTTIARKLLERNAALEFSVSATSRNKRSGEVHGRDYYFLTVQEFKTGIGEGRFLEWQEVYPNQYYGTLKRELDRIWENGHLVLFDVDVYGGINLKKILGTHALAVFIMPPDIHALETRLRNRSADSEEQIAVRLRKAEEEMALAGHFDYTIINDDLDQAIGEIEALIASFNQPES